MATVPHMPSSRESILQSMVQMMSSSWFRFINDLYKWVGTALPESSITVTSSPFTYSATANGWVIVNPGTVSKIEFSRNGTTFYTTGVTAGVFPVAFNDRIRVTYSGTPTMTMVPR